MQYIAPYISSVWVKGLNHKVSETFKITSSIVSGHDNILMCWKKNK